MACAAYSQASCPLYTRLCPAPVCPIPGCYSVCEASALCAQPGRHAPCGHLWHMLYFPFVMLCVQIVLAQNHGARCPAKALMHLHFCLRCAPSMRRLCRFCDAMRCSWTLCLLYRDTDWLCAEAGVLKFKCVLMEWGGTLTGLEKVRDLQRA